MRYAAPKRLSDLFLAMAAAVIAFGLWGLFVGLLFSPLWPLSIIVLCFALLFTALTLQCFEE